MGFYRDRNRESVSRHLIDLEGRFYPEGAGAITNASNEGQGFTVTRTGTGAYTLALDEEFLSLVSFEVDMQLAAAGDMMAELGDIDLANKAIYLRVVKKSDGTAVEAGALDANQSISFKFALKQTAAI